MDELICALTTHAAPIEFTDTLEDALALVDYHKDKRIIFISSASLGKDIIPKITANHVHVHSFYIFCGQIKHCLDWAMDYLDCLQMFDFEIDLLVRLARDISKDIINQGKMYMMDLQDPTSALRYFESARTLEERANARDTLNHPFHEHLKMLNGEQNKTGLIAQAREMQQQQLANVGATTVC
ncbi:unnamed protein product [Didymodactylos carnosus]|uniref:Uncharacterized protein n=1 Tax=Didymodactylos carnosus TaxID=1234261 RepID=A0A814TUH1_9BILA|nr:unnamed protein product [Didymodactylos carnosus]CAF1165561.1 unnamed protein product [Didymodactylos carnosus]CAF3519987.1 unnamed protein product [Didymodactylos carnosus]CAF3929219.1 unnamed protein product [Didymodactylos carnosus]